MFNKKVENKKKFSEINNLMGNLLELKNAKDQPCDQLNKLNLDMKNFVNNLLGLDSKINSYTDFDYKSLQRVPNSEIDAVSKQIFQDKETQEEYSQLIKWFLGRNDSSKLIL